jgi:hypothetical protein
LARGTGVEEHRTMVARILKTVVVLLVGTGAVVALALAVEVSRPLAECTPQRFGSVRPIRLAALEGPLDVFGHLVLAPEPEPVALVVRPRRHRRAPRATVVEAPAPLPAPADAFRLALRSARAAFERCYDQALLTQPDLDGNFVVSVQVSARGRIETAHILDVAREAEGVAACITHRLKALKLPPVSEDAELVLPIRLETTRRPG